MTALSYRLLTTDLIELWLAISISDLLATVLMQRSLVFPLIHYLLPSRLRLKLLIPKTFADRLPCRQGPGISVEIETATYCLAVRYLIRSPGAWHLG